MSSSSAKEQIDIVVDVATSVFTGITAEDIVYNSYERRASTKTDSNDTFDCIEFAIANDEFVSKELSECSKIYMNIALDKKGNISEFVAGTEIVVSNNGANEKLRCTVKAKHCIKSEMVIALECVIKYSKKVLCDDSFREESVTNSNTSCSITNNGKEKGPFNGKVVA